MIKDVLKEHYPLIAVVTFNFLLLLLVPLVVDLKGENVFAVGLEPLSAFLAFFVCIPLVFSVWYYIRAIDRGDPLLRVPDEVVELCTVKNLLRYILAFIVIYFSLLAFIPIKSLITYINPYDYDPLFAKIDHFLHFGKYPHEYLGFILDRPVLIHWFDIFYTSWFFYIYAYLVWVMLQSEHTKGRMQFILCFCLTWTVLGNIVALLAASVGPVFWEFYYDIPSPYIPLLNSLEEANAIFPLIQTNLSDWLLGLQYDGKMIDANGPSAMPSLHVAIATLIMFHSWSYSKLLFSFTSVYCFLTIIASVVLAWHYAIDGYVSLILVYILWKCSGFIESRFSMPQSDKNF